MIIRLTGGLGNQLFQWAYGRARAAEGLDIKYTLGEDMGASGYRLDRYPIDVPMATPEEVEAGPVMHGWWEDEREFAGVEREVRRAFTAPRLSRTARLLGPHMIGSGFIHVRRGDSCGSVSHAELFASVDYYRQATEAIDWHWYLFSDEPDWCERELVPQLAWPNQVTVMDRLSPEDDLWLMSQCCHAIIANSTFSWWAAWLGPDARGGTVVAPKDWLTGPKPHPTIVPGRWKTL